MSRIIIAPSSNKKEIEMFSKETILEKIKDYQSAIAWDSLETVRIDTLINAIQYAQTSGRVVLQEMELCQLYCNSMVATYAAIRWITEDNTHPHNHARAYESASYPVLPKPGSAAENLPNLIKAMPYFTSHNEIKYLNNKGKTTSAKIGKALVKILPALPEKERHQIADALKREFAPKPPVPLLFAENDQPEQWVNIYRRAADEYNITSCMTDDAGYLAISGYACAHLLPAEMRENQMRYKLAYLADDAGIPYARAIVDTEEMLYISTYSADSEKGEMEKSLYAAGYRYAQAALDGMYIYAGEDGDRAPYLDGHHYADDTYLNGIRFWIVSDTGDYLLTETNGYAPNSGAYCERCDSGCHEDEITRVMDYDGSAFTSAYVCDNCRRVHYTYVNAHSAYFPDRYVAQDNRGDYLVTHSNYTDEHICIDDDWYHMDDVVYSEYADEHFPANDTTFVDFLESYIPNHCINLNVADTYFDFSDVYLNQVALEVGYHTSQQGEAE